jgi:deoxyribonuclease-4
VRRIGVHSSIAGGIHRSLQRAQALGCNTVQIFSHNPRGWSVKERNIDEITTFRRIRQACNISPVFIHTSYLINLATRNENLLKKSVEMVIYEMDSADKTGAEFVVLHTGSATGDDPRIARERVAAALNDIAKGGRWKAGLLIENTAGERGDVTSQIPDIAEIMEKVPADLIGGVCIDTCHAFTAGYDVTSFYSVDRLVDEIDRYMGLEKVKLLHVNDAKGKLGSGVDRHEHIGCGNIGIRGFRNFLRHPAFSEIPIILETPKKTEGDDIRNLKAVRKILGQ